MKEMNNDRKDESSGGRVPLLVVRSVLVMVMLVAVTAFSCDRAPAELSSHTERSAGPDHDRSPAPATGSLFAHGPQHGGVVGSVDIYHVEVVEDPLEVWLYDRKGNLLPLAGVQGQIVIYSGDELRPYALDREGEHFSPSETVDLPDQGSAFVELTIDEQPFDVAFDLPLVSDAPAPPRRAR